MSKEQTARYTEFTKTAETWRLQFGMEVGKAKLLGEIVWCAYDKPDEEALKRHHATILVQCDDRGACDEGEISENAKFL